MLGAPVRDKEITARARAAWDTATQEQQTEADARKENYIHEKATPQTLGSSEKDFIRAYCCCHTLK